MTDEQRLSYYNAILEVFKMAQTEPTYGEGSFAIGFAQAKQNASLIQRFYVGINYDKRKPRRIINFLLGLALILLFLFS